MQSSIRFFKNLGVEVKEADRKGKTFSGGLVSIDIQNHSKLIGGEREKSRTKAQLRDFISEQLLDRRATLLSWNGDGGIYLFDVRDGCDEMILFADRIRHLIPHFNISRSIYNRLPHEQEILVRTACHVGDLLNENNNTGSVSGDAINKLAKYEREISRPGYVVATQDVMRNLSQEIVDRFSHYSDHRILGKQYVLDADISLARIHHCDRLSDDLRNWIKTSLLQNEYDSLLVFAYTNELLYKFFAYELDIETKILARNWVIERKEEQDFNNNMLKKANKNLPDTFRIWQKSGVIKLRAESLNNARKIGRNVEAKFFDAPPLFNGAILISKKGHKKAFIGISRKSLRREHNKVGGSPYKLQDWPALVLDGHDENQKRQIEYYISRFHEGWEKSVTYDEVNKNDEFETARESDIVRSFWEIGELPYLIVAPGRYMPNRLMPIMTGEDHEASNIVERFLQEYGSSTNTMIVPLPEKIEGQWYPEKEEADIGKWPGHIVYVCNLSIPKHNWNEYIERGFPFQINGTGTSHPLIEHTQEEGIQLKSPIDCIPSKEIDYSIIGKLRKSDRNQCIFLVTGIHAMGTWGAAEFLSSVEGIRKLQLLTNSEGFGAVLETKFDRRKKKLISTDLKIGPEKI